MARYTFGGDITHLVTSPDPSLGGALKVAPNTPLVFYSAPSGGAAVTDYLVDDGVGNLTAPATRIVSRPTGYLPSFKGPDNLNTLYYDPNPADADVVRVQLRARDAEAAGVSAATETTAGIVELATLAEVDAGTDTVRAVTPAGAGRAVDNHEGAADPHPSYGAAIGQVQAALAGKADLAGGVVPVEQLPASTTPTPGAIAQRRTGGQLAAVTAGLDDELTPLAQVRNLLAAGTPGADVRHRDSIGAAGWPLSSASATVFAAIPNIFVPDAASGQQWRCDYLLKYRATAAAGIQVRHKTQAAGVTNKLANPSFETNTASWTPVTAATALARATAGGGFDGAAYLTMTASSTGNLQMRSEWVPLGSSTAWSAGAYARLGAGAGHNFRIDIEYGDAAGIVLSTDLGSGTGIVVPTSGAWSRATNGVSGPSVPPAGATQVRVRVVYVSAVAGDNVHVDAVQLEPSSPLPAYGSTGGSGASALTIIGGWDGLITTSPTADDYRHRTPIRYPTVAGLTTAHGGLGTTADADLEGSFLVAVGGTGLTDQRIELEFAQRVLDAANPTSLVHADATFARVA